MHTDVHIVSELRCHTLIKHTPSKHKGASEWNQRGQWRLQHLKVVYAWITLTVATVSWSQLPCLLHSYEAVASSLLHFEYTVNNQLCSPSPPLTLNSFPFVRHWLLSVQTLAAKHSLSLIREETERGKKGARGARERRQLRRRQNGRKNSWLNLPRTQHKDVYVFLKFN